MCISENEKENTPEVIWENCAELEDMIQSHTAHDIYDRKGKVSDTMVTGKMGDISELAEFEWYFWAMFRNTAVSFPDSLWVLVRYCGPPGDVGPEMDAKLLK